MALTVYLSGHLKAFSEGEMQVSVDGDFATVGEVLETLWIRHPALRDRILNEQGEIRQHVNIFSGGRDIKRVDGLSTLLGSNEVHIFNAVSGG